MPSKKVTGPKFGTDKSDKQTLKIIRDYGLVSIVVGPHTVGNFLPPTELPKAIYRARTGILPKRSNDNRLPRWNQSGSRLKFGMAMQSLAGRGYAFSLNFGPERLAELLIHPRGFSRALARYMDRALTRKFGRIPFYCFVVEITRLGKLHIHGGIESTENMAHLTISALSQAAGKGWVPTRKGEKQVFFRDLFYPNGWCSYSFEDNPKARRVIEGSTVVITNPLRGFAKQLYRTVRKIVRSDVSERHTSADAAMVLDVP